VTRLALRRGTVVSVGHGGELTVEIDGRERPARTYDEITGPAEVGDDVVVNVAALDLGLGSGGFDIVHANLTRGLDGVVGSSHVMKLNYTSLQHPVQPIEESAPRSLDIAGKPVAVIGLHGQLPSVAWAAAQARRDTRIGYVQTVGGALPGSHSRVVRQLLDAELLAGHITAGAAFGAPHEAISTPGALHAGLTALDWDAAIVGPGPGILGSATTLGHGGLAALDNAHAALALGATTILVPRMSSGDSRERHRGLSHHTETVLEMMLRPALVALPAGDVYVLPGNHEARAAETDLDGYRASGLPASTMGRGIDDDELFFRASLAGGTVLAEEVG
jgi:Protein of unknown function (DUF3866)